MSLLDHSKTTAKRDELILRIVSALVLAPLTIGVTLLGGNVFDGFWFIAAVLMSYEFLRLITPFYRPFWGAVFIHVSIFFALYGFLSETNPGIVLKLIAPSLFLLFVWNESRAGISPFWHFMALFYPLVTLAAPLVIISHPHGGAVAMIWIFAVVWGTDIGAFFVGRLMGGPKLAPSISPGKTWSGFIGGMLFGTAISVAWIELAGLQWGWSWVSGPSLILICLMASIIGQIGDLFESFLKRRLGVKDSGRLIPGHGGIIDRLDSFLFVALYLLLLLISGTFSGLIL
ncbi:MAG: phosphatidate cytidylyltransferase [Beijerinckiaceae bacterium]|jgi:phosphatidate cytidylyltransferase